MITVVIPTRNRPDSLKRALKSVYYQTALPFEVIVIDDGSSPAVTEDVFAKAPAQIKTLLLRNNISKGAPNARNRGIDIATSEWIAFLDDDDEFAANKIEKIESFIKENEDVDIVYHRTLTNMVNENVTYVSPYLETVSNDVMFRRLLVKNIVGSTSAVVCKRSALIKCDKFDEDLKQQQDYELWLRCAKLGLKFKPLNIPLTNINAIIGGESISKGVERYRETQAYIEEKYCDDFAGLSKTEKSELKRRKMIILVRKSLFGGNIWRAFFFQFKLIFMEPSIKNLVLFIALPFGKKIVFKLAMASRTRDENNKRSES